MDKYANLCQRKIEAFRLIRKLGGWKHNEIALWSIARLEEYIESLREKADAKKAKEGNNQ